MTSFSTIHLSIRLTLLWITTAKAFNKSSITSGPCNRHSSHCFMRSVWSNLSIMEAESICSSGHHGRLASLPGKNETQAAKTFLVNAAGKKEGVIWDVWIGLRRNKGDCVNGSSALRGFSWSTGNADDTFEAWHSDANTSCPGTEDLCVSLRFTGNLDPRWYTHRCDTTTGVLGVLCWIDLSPDAHVSGETVEPEISQRTLAPAWHEWDVCSRCKNGVCSSESGALGCACLDGYTPLNGTHCTDIDECSGTSACQIDCRNFLGKLLCKCPAGFENLGHLECVETCPTQFPCSQVCTNTMGGYDCSCLQGYHLHHDGWQCIDESHKSAASPSLTPITLLLLTMTGYCIMLGCSTKD